jgi:hypothetical protein
VETFKIQEAKAKEEILNKDPRDLLLADVDRDGLRDVILFMAGEVPAVLFSRDAGEGPFKSFMGGETPGLGILEDSRAWTVCSADQDGDGQGELAVASGNLVRFVYAPEDGSIPQAVRQYNGTDPADRFKGCAVADVTGDDGPELVVFEERTGRVRVIGKDDELLLELDAGKIDFRGFETPDLNGDGKADILIKGKDRIGVWLAGRPGPVIEEMDTYESRDKETYFLDVAAGDLNSDEGKDAVLVDSGQNSMFIVSMTGEGMKLALKFRVFEEKLFESSRGSPEPHAVEIQDLTGDGKGDVVVLVHDKIIIYPQE